MYNDQPPNEPARLTNGHTKGAIITDENEGFWLIHSVPNFPPEPNTGEDVIKSKVDDSVDTNNSETKTNSKDLPAGGYSYPNSGRVNGQSFLCISMSGENLDTIGKQLMYNQIVVYRRNLANDLSSKYRTLADAAKQVRIKKPPYNNKMSFHSGHGMEFTSFAKTSKWNKGLLNIFM